MSSTEIGYIRKELPEKIKTIGLTLFVVGTALGIIGFLIDPQRASLSYLVTFMFLVSIGVGSLFLVALEYAVGADWSTPFRRISEFLAAVIPFLIILVIPLLFNLKYIFPWTHKSIVDSSVMLRGKTPYLNIPFFIIRSIGIFLIWWVFYYFIIRNSRKQDTTKDQYLTKKNINISSGFIPVFGISITAIAFDWMMSLEPNWFSTIFGVYYFSGTVWCALAALTLIVILLNEHGYLHSKIKSEHYYTLGLLMFAFTVFWAYIAFSQYLLIWYADLPDETIWFMHRWVGGWKVVSLAIVFTHFIFPFFYLLSYNVKMQAKKLKFIAIWILCAHFLDLYWLVMPGMSTNGYQYSFSWMDLVFPVAAVGLIILIFKSLSHKYNLLPIGDPKLQRGLDFHL